MATKMWFITGAGSGFGRELTARVLARGNCGAATNGRPERLADLARRYGGQQSSQAGVTEPHRPGKSDVIMRLHGRTALVTGSRRGIRRATAQRLAGEGSRVVVSGRNSERSDEVGAMITGAGGLAYVVPADLADARNLGVAGPRARSTELIPPGHTVILDGAKITVPIYGDTQ